MLFYNFNELDDFIKNDFINNLMSEKNDIENIINLYDSKLEGLSSTITNMIEMSDSIEKNKLEDFRNSVSLIKQSLEQLTQIKDLATKLSKDIIYTISLYDKGLENNKDEIKANLVEYNKQRDELFSKILSFETDNTSSLNTIIKLFSKKSNNKNENKKVDISNNVSRVNIELQPNDYNTLIISEKEQKAYLPFYYKDIKEIYQKQNNKYETMQDVIDDLYIVPLDRFKNSSISRFRESFNLIRNKEHKSLTKALDLGLELMFKYKLNPIVIAACRNLDELDIYLDCLENNELYDFKCFEIKFEVMPKIIKNRKKDTF